VFWLAFYGPNMPGKDRRAGLLTEIPQDQLKQHRPLSANPAEGSRKTPGFGSTSEAPSPDEAEVGHREGQREDYFH
jgi:hypothetical protein